MLKLALAHAHVSSRLRAALLQRSPAEEIDHLAAAIKGIPCHYADLIITATAVLPATNPTYINGFAGSTITAGQPVYKNASGLYQPVDATNSAKNVVAGIAMNGAAINQPVQIQNGGTYTVGATVVKGGTYVASGASVGGIAPVADLTTGNYVSILGVAIDTATIQLSILNTGITHA